MKQDIYAKVVGHQLFYPDAKDHSVELVKVKFEGQSPSKTGGKPSKLMLVMDKEDAFSAARLGTTMLFTFKPVQIELPLDEGAEAAPVDQERLPLSGPDGAARLRGRGRLGVVNGGRGKNGRATNDAAVAPRGAGRKARAPKPESLETTPEPPAGD